MLDRNDAAFLKCLLDWYLEQAEAQQTGANDADEEEWAFSGFRFDADEIEWATRLRRMMRTIEQGGRIE